MIEKAHKPRRDVADPKQLLLGYLDYYRSAIARKVAGLSEEDLRSSCVPSGWTPLELVKHLTFMERRWLVWGFLGEQVPTPRGDEDSSGHWYVSAPEAPADLIAAMYAGGARTRSIVEEADLADIAAIGGRFSDADLRPTLAWTLAYVLQEYARHAGQLDVVRELFDGAVGE